MQGDHSNFRHQINYLTGLGYRVIVPNFPTYTVTLTTKFNNSAQERSQFIKDFLATLNIFQIALVVAHSAGMYAAVQLLDDERFNVDNLVFINPAAGISILNARYRIILYRFVFRQLNSLYKLDSFREYMQPLVERIIDTASRNNPNVPSDMDIALLQACVIAYTDADDINKSIDNLKAKINENKIKLLMIFSEKDRFISVKKMYELAKFLSDNETFEYYDEIGNVEKNVEFKLPYITISRKGDHIFFVKDPSIVEKAMNKFLTHKL